MFKQGQTSYAWWGSSVVDYPLPEGFTTQDLGHCDHAIGVPGAGYEIGLARAKDGKGGWVMLFDFYGQGQPILKAIGDANCTEEKPNANKFLQTYGVIKAELSARKLGYSTTRQKLANGAINVVVQGRF